MLATALRAALLATKLPQLAQMEQKEDDCTQYHGQKEENVKQEVHIPSQVMNWRFQVLTRIPNHIFNPPDGARERGRLLVHQKGAIFLEYQSKIITKELN